MQMLRFLSSEGEDQGFGVKIICQKPVVVLFSTNCWGAVGNRLLKQRQQRQQNRNGWGEYWLQNNWEMWGCNVITEWESPLRSVVGLLSSDSFWLLPSCNFLTVPVSFSFFMVFLIHILSSFPLSHYVLYSVTFLPVFPLYSHAPISLHPPSHSPKLLVGQFHLSLKLQDTLYQDTLVLDKLELNLVYRYSSWNFMYEISSSIPSRNSSCFPYNHLLFSIWDTSPPPPALPPQESGKDKWTLRWSLEQHEDQDY